MKQLIQTLFIRKDELWQALIEHLQLSLLSLLLAILLAIPLAIYLTRKRKVAEIILQLVGIFQTIPSLALLGLLIPFIGIGTPPTIIALVVYALFPILQSSYTGLEKARKASQFSKR